MQNLFTDLYSRLSEVPFVAGIRYSVADVTALATIDFAVDGLKLADSELRGRSMAHQSIANQSTGSPFQVRIIEAPPSMSDAVPDHPSIFS
ncbi:glutathione S-transferase [Paraburkholderia sp. GAS448]|uniref:hypothetical protein n=1 Tax=Paraburkholderia sp. GAS448 TaxID=3035136 RepID=UPI003D214BEF